MLLMICGIASPQDKGLSSGETELPTNIETPKSAADIEK
jgi:hypothetical protein